MDIRRIGSTLTMLAFAAFIAVGCGGNSAAKNGICTVGDGAVPKKEFVKMFGQAKRNYTSQGQKFPKKGSADYKQLQNQVVDFLIKKELYAQEAEKLDITVKEKDVDKRLKELKKSFFQGDKKKYKAELKKQNLTEEDVKDNIRQQVLTEKLFEKITKDVKVSDGKAEEYYKEKEADFKTPEQRDVAHILVKTKKEADAVYKQVKGGDEKVFAKVAKKKSTDPSSAQTGGTLTAVKGQLVPEFEKEAFRLKVGETSKPIKTTFGYHVIQARGEIKPAKKQTFKEVEEQIKQTLQQEQRSKRMQDWETDLRKDAEKDVKCKKGYSWTQTVTNTQPPAEAPREEEAPADSKKGKKEKAKDKAAKVTADTGGKGGKDKGTKKDG